MEEWSWISVCAQIDTLFLVELPNRYMSNSMMIITYQTAVTLDTFAFQLFQLKLMQKKQKLECLPPAPGAASSSVYFLNEPICWKFCRKNRLSTTLYVFRVKKAARQPASLSVTFKLVRKLFCPAAPTKPHLLIFKFGIISKVHLLYQFNTEMSGLYFDIKNVIIIKWFASLLMWFTVRSCEGRSPILPIIQ